MNSEPLWSVILMFLSASFIGWVIETIYRSFRNWRFINAGMLKGPYVPIYGTAGTLMLFLSHMMIDSPFLLQVLLFTIIATILEYVTSFALERIFHLKLWDYSDEQWNIRGRVCLRFSGYWAALIAIYLLFVQGPLYRMIMMIPPGLGWGLSILGLAVILVDLLFSSRMLKGLNSGLQLLSQREQDYTGTLQLDTGIEIPLFWKQLRRLMIIFPDLIDTVQEETVSAVRAFLHGLGPRIYEEAEYRSDERFMETAGDIIDHKMFQMLKDYRHHDDSIYTHSCRVAYVSFIIGKRFEKRMDLDMYSLIRGALLHDFFHYDWRQDRPEVGERHAFYHPKEAHTRAQRFFGPLTLIEEDMILKHMWPLTIRQMPKYPETFILLIVDKIVASKEFLMDAGKQKGDTPSKEIRR